MRRMSKLASILDKSILADDEGNIEAKKDVKIDGNLKFKSLVSGSNPEGIFDPSSGGSGGGGNTLYEYHLYFGSNNLGISMEGKLYTDVDIGASNKIRTSEQIKEQLLPKGAGYTLTLDVFGSIKITEGENTTYYPLVKLDFATYAITLYYLDTAKGMTTYSHNFLVDTDNKWNVIRNVASPRNG